MKTLNKSLLCILLCLFVQMYSYSQPSITWQRLYNGQFFYSSDNGRGICETTNGNIYLTGFELSEVGIRGVVLKLKPNGDTIWIKYFNGIRGYLIVSSNDGGCIITGESSLVYTLKLDSNGNSVWLKTYGMQGTSSSDMIKTNDGGYAICGYQAGGSPPPAYALKIDSLGNMKWQKYFYAGDIKRFLSISEKINGNYIISGYKYDCKLCNGYPLLLELNNSGDSLWEKKYNLFADFKKIYSNKNGYLIGGTILDSPFVHANTFIMRTTLSGEINFRKNINYKNREDFKDMKIMSENRYVIACDTDTLDRRSAGVYIIDSLANIIHRNIFYVTDYTLFFSIFPLLQGDIVFSGTVETYLPQRRDIFAVRTDSTLFAKPLSVRNYANNIVNDYKLFQNYPNPFNPKTIINYEIAFKNKGLRHSHPFGQPLVLLKVYSILGKEVATLVNTKQNAGSYNVNFDARLYGQGNGFASGVYFYRLLIDARLHGQGNTVDTKRMVLLK